MRLTLVEEIVKQEGLQVGGFLVRLRDVSKENGLDRSKISEHIGEATVSVF